MILHEKVGLLFYIEEVHNLALAGYVEGFNWEGRTKSGGLRSCTDRSGAETDQDILALIKYTADEDKLEKVLENPQVIKTPVVRNGKQFTIGYQPEVWKGWN